MIGSITKSTLAGLALLFTVATSVAEESAPGYGEWHHEDAAIMGTRVSVTFWCEISFDVCESLLAKTLNEFRRLDQLLSPYISSSELSRVNRTAATKPVVLSDELFDLVQNALYYSELSNGAFDITFASLGQYFDYREGKQPDTKLVRERLAAINYHWLTLDRKQRTLAFKQPQVKIDLGGIAKGYAVDRAMQLLQDAGIAHASISAGGDSRVLGDRNGKPWRVGIKKPRADDGQPALVIPMLNEAISTSGDYERYFIDASGKRIHHILNPKTGTAATGVVSVSVLAPLSYTADPLSTTVFILGVEKGLALVERLSNVEAVIIDSSGKVHFTSGLTNPQ